MFGSHYTIFTNFFNGLGHFVGWLIMANAIFGFLPIFLCFYSNEYSIGGEDWVGQIALWELWFFVAAAGIVIILSTSRIDLRNLPAGWRILRLFSVWANKDESTHFGRRATVGNIGDTEKSEEAMSDEDEIDERKDYPATRTRKPDRYSAVPPITTVSGKRVNLRNWLPTAVEHGLEKWRETSELKEVERQTETLKKKTEANIARKDYITSDVDADNAEERAYQRHSLERGRYLREAAEIERDIKSIQNPAKTAEPPSRPQKPSWDEIADSILETGFPPHSARAKAENKIAELIRKRGGEGNLTDQDHENIRRLREEAARRDQGQ